MLEFIVTLIVTLAMCSYLGICFLSWYTCTGKTQGMIYDFFYIFSYIFICFIYILYIFIYFSCIFIHFLYIGELGYDVPLYDVFCIWRTICLVAVRCISSIRCMYTTDFAYDGPIFLVPLSLSYPSSPVYSIYFYIFMFFLDCSLGTQTKKRYCS